MAAATCSISFLDKICSCFIIFIQEIKRIGRKPSIRIWTSTGKKSVYFILSNKYLMFLPCEFISCTVWNYFCSKFLKLTGYSDWIIGAEPHNAFIFLISHCQSFQTLIQICRPLRICQFLFQIICYFRINAVKMWQIFFSKDKFCYTLCHICLHIGKCLCMFLYCIFPCNIKYGLRCIFPLFQELMDTAAHILPG